MKSAADATTRPAGSTEASANGTTRRVGYLCGSPRVSTRPDAEAAGPRSHVVGMMRAFEQLGWEVAPFIVGDVMPTAWTGSGSERLLTRSRGRALAADVVRLVLRVASRRRAVASIGSDLDWVYERYAAFQDLGQPFRRRGVPWILETNGPFFYEAAADRKSMVLKALAKRKEAKAYRACDVVVCISETLKEIIVEQIGIDPGKIVVIPNGVDVATFDPGVYEGPAAHPWLQIGFVGHLIDWQGIDALIHAVAAVRRRGMDVRLSVTGDGPMLEPWRDLAADLNLGGSIEFTGRVPASEVPSRIAVMDIGFSSTTTSGLGRNYRSPLKLYEYLAMGKPVLSSICEDSDRAVREGETGFLFDQDEPADLERAIVRAWSARERLGDIGARAREEAVKTHSWETRLGELITAVERIVRHR